MSAIHVVESSGLAGQQERCPACGEVPEHERCVACGAAVRVKGYVVRRLLVSTPHSRVYLAADASGREVALKELLFSLVPGVEQLDAFQREERVLRQLDHPRIPKVLDAFAAGSGPGTRLYLVQEYVAGRSLEQLLAQGLFTPQEAMKIAREVLVTLVYLQGLPLPVVHRDVKPANLIRRSNGEIALVDFGSARGVAQATHRSTLVGTFGYMPPEQLGGTVDATTDLYALGATLVHLLTGSSPDKLLDPSLRIVFAPRVKMSRRFRDFLARLVEPIPARRFASAREALRALDRGYTAPRPTRIVVALTLGIALNVVIAGALLFTGKAASQTTLTAPVRAESPANELGPLVLEVEPQPESAVREAIAALRAAGRTRLADTVEKRINRSKQRSGKGLSGAATLVGRVVTPPGVDPIDLDAQMEVLDDGWFVTEIASWEKPLSLRNKVLEPVDVRLKHPPPDVAWLGELSIPRLSQLRATHLQGRVVLDPSLDAATLKGTMRLAPTPNTPSNGVEARPHWAESIPVSFAPDGTFTTDRIPLGAYYLSLEAPRRAAYHRMVVLPLSDPHSLDAVKLEVSLSLSSATRVAATGEPFSPSTKGAVLKADAAVALWPQLPDVRLRVTQEEGELKMRLDHGPCSLTDLGPGTIDTFAANTPTPSTNQMPLVVLPGHVYLVEFDKRRALIAVAPAR